MDTKISYCINCYNELMEVSTWKKKEPENTYGFVSDENGKIFPLFINHYNCIMTSGGKTFANVSQK